MSPPRNPVRFILSVLPLFVRRMEAEKQLHPCAEITQAASKVHGTKRRVREARRVGNGVQQNHTERHLVVVFAGAKNYAVTGRDRARFGRSRPRENEVEVAGVVVSVRFSRWVATTRTREPTRRATALRQRERLVWSRVCRSGRQWRRWQTHPIGCVGDPPLRPVGGFNEPTSFALSRLSEQLLSCESRLLLRGLGAKGGPDALFSHRDRRLCRLECGV